MRTHKNSPRFGFFNSTIKQLLIRESHVTTVGATKNVGVIELGAPEAASTRRFVDTGKIEERNGR